ncbi:acyl carrier protein [Bordetella tumulicola]|uniref:acyl carrier protein n=1 Tax=Bordetella tumulicola TaxID=1649133 RepID=UPI0039F121A6
MTQQDIFDVIVRHTRDVLPNLTDHPFQSGDSLKALGANSVDRADIIMMTLETLALNVPLVEMARADSIGNLAEIMYAKG